MKRFRTLLTATAGAIIILTGASTGWAWDSNCKNAWAGGESDDEPWHISPAQLRDIYGTRFSPTERNKMNEFDDSWGANYAAYHQQGGYYHYILLYFESNYGVKWLRANARFAAKLESGNAVGIWAWDGNGSWGDALAINEGGNDPDVIKGISVDDYLIWDAGENRSHLILLLAGVNGPSFNEMWCDVCDINILEAE